MTSTNSAEQSESQSAAQDIPQQPRPQEEVHTPTPVEMSSLAKNNPLSSEHDTSSSSHPITTSAEPHIPGPMRTDTTTALNQSMNPAPSPPPAVADPQAVTRTFSTAIGPASDSPVVPAKDVEVTGPVLVVTLLLTSGARHPFRLDAKYLAKRNVEVADADPFNLSVYKLKELILREWREEWEAKPSSPNYIRLISMGKMLDDKASLKDYKFGTDSPNVLHMTIKPQDYVEDEDAKGGKSSMAGNRESEGRSPGCRCIIM